MNNQRIVAFVNLKRAINIMKLTVLMLTVCLSQVFAATYAQTAKLTVSAKNETLENVLKQIEKQKNRRTKRYDVARCMLLIINNIIYICVCFQADKDFNYPGATAKKL